MTLSLTIDGKPWTVRRVPRKRIIDAADGSANHRRRVIHIATDLSPEAEVETVLHEVIHARCWDLAEEAVDEIARAQALALWHTINGDW